MNTKEIQVLCIWQPNDQLKDYFEKELEKYPQVKFIYPQDIKIETLLELAPKADIIMGWRPTLELLQAAKKLQLFINPGAGVQHLIPIFKEATVNREIILVNGHGNAYFTAQHAVAILLALMNKVIPHHNWMVEGYWRRGDSFATSTPLRDKTIGLLGYGAVNRRVHKFLSGFDVEFAILRQDWFKQKEPLCTPAKQYTFDELNNFLEIIDILIIAVPLTSKTRGLINEEQLQLLGKNSFIVNIGRGEVIDEESLFKALNEKKIAGASIDVWYNYQPQEDEKGKMFPSIFPFYELDNVVLSPHRGASPMNDLKRWDEQIENIVLFAQGRKDFVNIVNLDEGY